MMKELRTHPVCFLSSNCTMIMFGCDWIIGSVILGVVTCFGCIYFKGVIRCQFIQRARVTLATPIINYNHIPLENTFNSHTYENLK